MGEAHHFVRRRREDQAEQRSREHRGDRAQHPVIKGGNLTEGAHQIRQLRGKIQLAGLQAQAQLIAKWVADEEKRQHSMNRNEFGEVELWVGGREHQIFYPKDPIDGNYKITFTGRLLDSTDSVHVAEDGRVSRPTSETPLVEVYEMIDRRLAVYRDFRKSVVSEKGATCVTYSDFKALCKAPGALETQWDLPQEDEMQMTAVTPFETRPARIRGIIGLADWFGKDKFKQWLPTINDGGGKKITEAEIDSVYERVEGEVYDMCFLKSVGDALGAETVVRICQPFYQTTSNETAK